MKKMSFLLSSLICFTLLPELLLALPKEHSVVAGDVSVHQPNSRTMVIEASNKAVINYKDFNIQKGEKIRFVQPSSSSSVLNRIKGGNPSKILGKMESNGKVFLVNSKGIYFGPKSVVKVGSLIASTLDVSNENFAKENFSFFLENKQNLSEIRNDGLLASAPEGSIVLMSPVIRNYGTIQANAGKVVLAAGEFVTLDFHGDKLLSFTVEGDVKGAVLEHLGSIEAEGGEVSMRLPTARKAISEIVNRDGLEKGEVFIQEDGEIRLVSSSYILAKKVDLEAGNLCVDGKIDASSSFAKGGEVRLSGTEISLKDAEIDVSGSLGGGEVLIGGEYQGGGDMPYASKVFVDESSLIVANAVDMGDGGTVVLWSKDRTSFEGSILSTGGSQGGNGGKVESSSLDNLSVFQGSVDATAVAGQSGEWLLDPTTLTVQVGFAPNPTPACTGGVVGAHTINTSSTPVVLCANTIVVNAPIDMTSPSIGILFTAPQGTIGELQLNAILVRTTGGPIASHNMSTVISTGVLIDTTSNQTFLNGADITMGVINTDGGGESIVFQLGYSGDLTVGNLGLLQPFGSVTSKGTGTANMQSVITQGGPISISQKITLASTAIFSTVAGSSSGGPITLNTLDGSYAGGENFGMLAGSGLISMGTLGENTPLGNVSIVSASQVSLSDIFTLGGDITILPDVVIDQIARPATQFVTFSEVNPELAGNVSLGNVYSTVPLLQALTISTGLTGIVEIGNIGTSTTPLGALLFNTNRGLTVGEVYASSWAVLGGGGTLTLEGDVYLAGILPNPFPDPFPNPLPASLGLAVVAGEILIGGNITASSVALYSLTSILNLAPSLPGQPVQPLITATGGLGILADITMDAAFGTVGTIASPILLNTTGPVTVGGRQVNLAGTFPPVTYIPRNRPCLVRFGGLSLSCALSARVVYNLLPRNIFKNSAFTPSVLGIGNPTSPGLLFIQNSAFSPINSRNNRLPAMIVMSDEELYGENLNTLDL